MKGTGQGGRRKYLTMDEIAEELAISSSTIYQEIVKGNLKAKHFGGNIRVHVDEFERYQEEQDYKPSEDSEGHGEPSKADGEVAQQEADESGGKRAKAGSAAYMALIREKSYLSPTEAAAITGRSKTTIYKAMGAGELEFLAIGCRSVIEREALDDWMRRGAPR